MQTFRQLFESYKWLHHFKKRNDLIHAIPCMEFLNIDYICVENLIIAMDVPTVRSVLTGNGFTSTTSYIPHWKSIIGNHPAEKIIDKTSILTNHRVYNETKNIEVHLVKPQFWSAVVTASAVQGALDVPDRISVFCSVYRTMLNLLLNNH